MRNIIVSVRQLFIFLLKLHIFPFYYFRCFIILTSYTKEPLKYSLVGRIVVCFTRFVAFHFYLFDSSIFQICRDFALYWSNLPDFFYKQHFYKQRQADIGKKSSKSSNTLRVNFCYLKIIHTLDPRYHPKSYSIF